MACVRARPAAGGDGAFAPYAPSGVREALKLITINPARQLRIDSRVGSIDVGKDADLVLYDKHRLSVYAAPQRVWIDGAMYFDRARDLAAHEARAAEKPRLLDKARSRPRQTAVPSNGRPNVRPQ